jgi:hypothetical protein
MIRAIALVMALAACGGGKPADTTPTGGAAQARSTGDELVPPEKMDEINRDLDRKRQTMAHCLATAVDNKELPRAARGELTVELVITGGRAESVKIVRSTLESQTLSDCVISHVKEIQFPELPRPYETSYTYGFEAM